MSIPQEAGKVATSVVDALKGSPALLVVVLLFGALNGVFIGFTYMAMQRAADRDATALQSQQTRDHEERMDMIKRCFPVSSTYSSGGATEGR